MEACYSQWFFLDFVVVLNTWESPRAALRSLNHLRKLCPVEAWKMVCYGLMHSKLQWGLAVYGSAYKTTIQQLYVIQKVAIRRVCGVSYRSHSDPLFSQFGILALRCLFYFKVRSFARGLLNYNKVWTLDFIAGTVISQ